jgi:uncharacterized LabA/DUF88 family protein
MSRRGVKKFTRDLRYRDKTIKLSDGSEEIVYIGEEKGIDVRIAIDVIRMAIDDEYDVAVIFSQDQDLSEATDEVKKISSRFDRWIRVASVFPDSARSNNHRGINGTEWVKIEQSDYENCCDETDYRPKK